MRLLISPSTGQWTPAVLIRKLRANDADIRSKHDVGQDSGPGDSVHSERARLPLVDIAREHIPHGWLDQETMRFDAAV